MKMLKILYKLTSRSRRERCEDTIASIVGSSSTDKEYMILLSLDTDDKTMKDFNYPYYTDGRLVVKKGTSKNKIDAINRDVNEFDWDWDILVNVSDDMIIEKGFDSVVRQSFEHSLDLFLHLPDGYANERLATMSIMGRDYYRRFGYIYHPSYESVYCDNEAMDVAKMLGRYVYVDKHVFKHFHPSNVGQHLMDEQYRKTEAKEVHARDCENYQKRKSNNFEDRLLSILICTIPSRSEMFKSLVQNLQGQINRLNYSNKVEILCDDSLDITTGYKRNCLLSKASGLFSVFIDDDDLVSENYVEKIVSCIMSNPNIDCIGIQGVITNGPKVQEWEISKDFERWYEANNKYYRTPNHISPIRTEHCIKAQFPNVTFGEDIAFSKNVLQYLKSECKIDEKIYFYRYNITQSQTPTQQFETPYRHAWR